MGAPSGKVYVAVGNDLNDGLATLDWALQNCSSSRSISIVILYATTKSSSLRDLVYTPFGKVPASAVSDKVLRGNKKYEQEKSHKFISQYMAFCGQVKTELLKVELSGGELIHKFIVDLISKLRITKLVMSISFMKASSWSPKNALSGSFYIHKHRSSFCSLHIICGGKLLFLGEDNEERLMEDGRGTMVANTREKNKCSGRLGEMSEECSTKCQAHENSPCSSSTLYTSGNSIMSQWERHVQEINRYHEEMLCLNAAKEPGYENANGPETAESNTSIAERHEDLRMKMKKMRETVQLKREEAKAYVERRAKAEWAISLCTQRTKELEARINDEMTIRMGLEKELESSTETMYEVLGDVRERKNRISSVLEIQSQLSGRLRLSSLAKSRAESQLEKAVNARADMVREIEELHQQRDVLHRRIEFCRDKDAIGKAAKLSNLGCCHREFTAEEIRLATDNFSENLKLKSGGDLTSVYRGRINCTTVAIKLLDSVNGLSEEAFEAKVKFLNNLRHPNLVATIGFCYKPRCVVFEYMHSGSLNDVMFSSRRNTRRKNRALHWRHCIQIAADVCAGLGFLHLAEPRPIVLGNLSPMSILLGRNRAAKIHCFGAAQCFDKGPMQSDVRSFGLLVLQLLAGVEDSAWPVPVEEAARMDTRALFEVLESAAGEWPKGLALEFAQIGLRCLLVGRSPDEDLKISTVMEAISEVRKKGAITAATERCEVASEDAVNIEESSNVPNVFLCPINQEVMRNPHVAADGFSYELEAIEEWIGGQGQETSPMTNLKLKHTDLTPNHTLRSLIEDWHNKRSHPSLPN